MKLRNHFLLSINLTLFAFSVCLSANANTLDLKPVRYNTAKYAIQVSTNFATPFDRSNSDVKAGFGIETGLLRFMSPDFALRLTFGYSGLRLDRDQYYTDFYYPEIRIYKQATPPLPPGISYNSYRSELTIMRLMLSGQYFSQRRSTPVGDASFYLFAGPGAAIHKTTLETHLRNDSTGVESDYIDSKTIIKPAVTFGFGSIIYVSQNMGLDISAACDLVHSGNADYFENQPHFRAYNYDGSFSIRLGLMTKF